MSNRLEKSKSLRLKVKQECPICMCEFLEGDEVSRPSQCHEKHLTHKECLAEITAFNIKHSIKHTCSICRTEFKVEDLVTFIFKGLENLPQDLVDKVDEHEI